MKSIILLLLFTGSLLAQPVVPYVPPKTNAPITLAWDASPTTNVTHYWLKRGVRSGTYTEMMRLDGRQTLTAVWTNTVMGATNFFIVTAGTASGLESDPSNELSVVLESRPAGVTLRTAVPLQATIQSLRKDGTWEDRLEVGPYYVLTDDTNAVFRVKLLANSAVPILPK